MTTRRCARCRAVLRMGNPGLICLPCQEKLVDERVSVLRNKYLDVEDMRVLLGLKSQEQVKRLARNGKLPPRIPAVRRWLWEEAMVRDWMRSGYEISQVVKEQVKALAEAHGGADRDDATGEITLGDKEDIQVAVYSKNGNEVVRQTKLISFVIPKHHE